MRALTVAALTCVLLAGGCTKDKQPDPQPNPNGKSGIVMKIAPSKAQYAAGEQIVLKIELGNAQGTSCRASKVPEGSVAFVSLTLDGNAVIPGIGEATYLDGMASHLRRNLVSLSPSAAVSMELRSETASAMDKATVLKTSTLDGLDEAAITYWPVDTAGKYTLSARYVPAALPDGPGDMCRSSGEPVTTEFTIAGR
jgi:hypothetical protein